MKREQVRIMMPILQAFSDGTTFGVKVEEQL